MSVDKFGRYLKKNKGLVGPKGEGFNLTQDGDYDIQGKRLCNVDNPYENRDAVNFKTHVESLLNCMTKQSGHFDAQNTRVCSVAEPVDNGDAVTKQYMHLHIPVKLLNDSSYSIHQYRLQDVAAPINNGDAVNLKFHNENTIPKTKDNSFDAKQCVIHNVAPPLAEKDAVNLEYLSSNAVIKNKDGVFDVKNILIRNVAPPVAGGDAINKAYMDTHLPILGTETWNFRNKRISQIGAPKHKYDAISLDYLQNNTIHPVTEIDGKHWGVRNRRITKLMKPKGLSDAVNKEYLKEALADLAFTLLKVIKNGARDSIQSKASWDQQVVQESSTWDQLFSVTTAGP